jgi:hypothetical protein
MATACEGAGSPQSGISERRDSADIQITYTPVASGAPTCDATDQILRIGRAAGDSASEFYGLNDAARLSDGRLVALNAGTQQLKVYSPTGDLVGQFGRGGRGPGEFRSLWSIDPATADTLIIADYRPWRFSYFTPDGAFVRSVELSPPMIERPDVAIPLATGYLMGDACCSASAGTVVRTVTLQRYGPDGFPSDTIGSFAYDKSLLLSAELRFLGPPIFGATAAFAYLGDGSIAYGPGRHEQIEVWDTAGRLRSIIRWHTRDRLVTAEDAAEWKRQLLERFPPTNPMSQQFMDAQIGDHRPVASTFPGHAEVIVDRAGRLWVKEYDRPLDEESSRWLVFEQDGRFVCQLRIPVSLQVFDAGMDYVLGAERDDLGVEYLVQYRVRPPGLGEAT